MVDVAVAPPFETFRLPARRPAVTGDLFAPKVLGIERGDLIVAAGEVSTDRVDALYEALDGARAAGELRLTILRGADERTVTVSF